MDTCGSVQTHSQSHALFGWCHTSQRRNPCWSKELGHNCNTSPVASTSFYRSQTQPKAVRSRVHPWHLVLIYPTCGPIPTCRCLGVLQLVRRWLQSIPPRPYLTMTEAGDHCWLHPSHKAGTS
uniref:RNA polymerase n=1 Tax=uncultured marine virus TaxID=186617 RepID=A0A0F7L5V1_9VIRU|nr:RNA polymerase [uncultured marine virus]